MQILRLLKRNAKPKPRTVEVGWIIDAAKAGFIWEAPRKLTRDNPPSKHAKSANYCPAVLDHEARIFEVPCPIDLTLRFKFDEKHQPILVTPSIDQSSIRPKFLSQMLALVGQKEWRHPDRPILQIVTPYLFVADEPVFMTQLPPFCHYRSPPWPGVLIGGRLPIHIWPRIMLWAFEWHEQNEELVLRRGEPWFYLRFETEDPSRAVRLIEAEMTPQLSEYKSAAAEVTNYVNRTFSLFNTARAPTKETRLSKQR